MWYFEYPARNITPEELADRTTLLDCQRTWSLAVQRFEGNHFFSEAEKITVLTLKIQLYIMTITTDCSASTLQRPYDAHLGLFKEIVRLSRIILDSMDLDTARPSARFTFEISLIAPIYLTATRCRCPVTRREALALLKRHPPREGMWDPESHAVVVRINSNVSFLQSASSGTSSSTST
jgi:hypothetical protein